MEVFAFLSYVVIMAFTPGPNNLMALSASRRLGLRGAAPFLGGLFVSFFFLNGVIYCCIHSLQAVLPQITVPLQAAGSAYIIFLIYTILVPARTGCKAAPNKKTLFLAGIFLNLTNVKVMLFMLIGYISFILPAYQTPLAILSWGVLMCLAASASNVIWAVAGAGLDRFFKRHERIVSVGIAVLLLISVVEIWI